MYLTKAISDVTDMDADIGIVGTLDEFGSQGGRWMFISQVQRGNGRKMHSTAEQAIPRWFTGYMVGADSERDAVELTRAYRLGFSHWANEHALAGNIRTVRKGRVA